MLSQLLNPYYQNGILCRKPNRRNSGCGSPCIASRDSKKAWCRTTFSKYRTKTTKTVECSGQSELDDYAIQLTGVRATRGQARKQVLHGINLNVKRGTLHMLVGPNGCGKSTLLRVLAGMIPTTGGSCTVDSPASLVFQNPDHQVVMPTVGADVAFGLGTQRDLPPDEVRSRVRVALSKVRMEQFLMRPVHTLSGGQKQRVAIAGALADKPKVLLLDELTTFLDFSDQRGVLEAVRRAVDDAEDPVTAIWVTHRLEELEFADGATCIENGQDIFSGSGYAVIQYVEMQKRNG